MLLWSFLMWMAILLLQMFLNTEKIVCENNIQIVCENNIHACMTNVHYVWYTEGYTETNTIIVFV